MLITIIAFVIILALMVLVHELGHFFTARLFGVKVEEFGLGLPPRALVIFQRKGTIYSLNWLPLGGFVKIKGEQGEGAGEPDSFISRPRWQRGIILASGVTMNVILTIVLFTAGFFIGLPQVIENNLPPPAKITNEEIQIVEILPNSPAAEAEIKLGDIILSLNGQKFKEISEIQQILQHPTLNQVTVEIKRGSTTLTKEIKTQVITQTQQKGLGVALIKTGLVAYPWYLAIYKGIETTVILFKEIILAFWFFLTNLFSWQKVAVEIAGPVGIAVLTGMVVKMGFIYLLQFTALLSLNLAIINFLPIPALDGGRFLFLIIETIRGKPISQKLENLAHNIGFILLMFLVLLITVRDISRFQEKFVSLWQKITSWF